MPRFRNIEAAVDSFRTQGQREKALSAHQLDSIPRKGADVFKQGNLLIVLLIFFFLFSNNFFIN